jgi:hypothetical protein
MKKTPHLYRVSPFPGGRDKFFITDAPLKHLEVIRILNKRKRRVQYVVTSRAGIPLAQSSAKAWRAGALDLDKIDSVLVLVILNGKLQEVEAELRDRHGRRAVITNQQVRRGR